MSPPEHTAPVLVLGDGMRAFLAVVRSLGRAGIRVEAGTHQPERPEYGSRYIETMHPLPPPERDPDRFCDAVLDLAERRGFSLIVPTTDPALLPIHHGRDRFLQHRIAIPGPAAFEACFDKFATHRVATRLGFPLPQTVLIEGAADPKAADAKALVAALGLPLVLKPRRSFSRQHLTKKAVVRTAYTRAEVQLHIDDLLAVGPILAQRSFRGCGVGVGFLADGGQPRVLFQHVRVHEPPHGGGSSYRCSEALDPRLRDLTERFVRATRYTGVGMLEFKRAASGDVVFIEANGRFWGSLPLALACGVDFPRYLYGLAVHGGHDFPRAYPTGVYARNLRHDARWLARTVGASPARRHVPRTPAAAIARGAVRMVTGREHSDSFVRDDVRPAVRELSTLSRIAADRMARRLRAAAASLPPARRRARRALVDAYRAAASVLFVCKGNICRSPFAAAFAARSANGTKAIDSAGYHPVPGRKPPEAAVRCARAHQLRLEDHRSRVLDPRTVDVADLIVVFDQENLDEMHRRFPEARAKTHRLDPDGPIQDPFGTDEARFEVTYRRIADRLRTLETG